MQRARSFNFLQIQVLFALSCLVVSGFGYQQEFILHESEGKDGNYFVFRKNVPDLSKYPLQDVTKMCVRGSGAMYNTTNYTKFYSRFNSGGGNLFCTAWIFKDKPIMGFRFGGASNAALESLSLFSETMWQGTEILVTGSKLTDISTPVLSFMATGSGNWTLFNEKDLKGKSACWHSGFDKNGRLINFHADVTTLGISTVGSVTQGC